MYTQQVIAKITEDESGFENHILELEKIYSAVENEEIDLATLSNTSCITETAKAFDSRKLKIVFLFRNKQIMVELQVNDWSGHEAH